MSIKDKISADIGGRVRKLRDERVIDDPELLKILKDRGFKKLPEGKGLTREQLAALLDCKVPSLGTWERGSPPFPVLMLRKVAEIYGVTMDYLTGLTDQEDAIRPPDTSGGLITWEEGAVPTNSDSMKLAIKVFHELVSGRHSDWDSLLQTMEGATREEDVMRIIEEAISSRLIKIETPLKRDEEIEKRLLAKYPGLKKNALLVIDFPIQLRKFSSFLQLLVALSAAEHFTGIAKSGDLVALSGGSTLLKFARCIPHIPKLEGLSFYPIDINPLADQVEFDATSIVALLKERLKCKGVALHYSATYHKKFSIAELRDTREIFEVFRNAGQSNIALVGIGNPLTRPGARFSPEQFISPSELAAKGVVADLLYHLIREDGQQAEFESKFNDRVVSLPLEDLQRMAKSDFVIGMAHGEEKAAAVRAVLNGRYLSGLITHTSLAEKLLKTEDVAALIPDEATPAV